MEKITSLNKCCELAMVVINGMAFPGVARWCWALFPELARCFGA